MKPEMLKRGVNLGGWLSQFGEKGPEHFDTFITRADIHQIRGWGFDHVRLPVDYIVLEEDAQPGTYLQSGFDRISRCLDWCWEVGLRVILDLHKAPGYAFDAQAQNDFETNPRQQDRFIALWAEITRRYAEQDSDFLAFELLNEVVFDDFEKWNVIVRRTVAQIRALDAERLILFGGNTYSSVDTLAELPDLADANILPKFHFYLPMMVTHQKAYWVPALLEFDREVPYPGEVDGLADFLRQNPAYAWRLRDEVDARFDKGYLRRRLAPALAFMQARQTALHCGEFGVIDRAPLAARLNWTRDMVSLLQEAGIGYAYWTYKAMDFGLVDAAGAVVSRDLIAILTG